MTSRSDTRPLIGLTMGDPAGIGPEIVARCLADEDLARRARFVVYGAGAPLTLAADMCGVRNGWYRINRDQADDALLHDSPIVIDDDSHGDLLHLDHQPTRCGGLASKMWVEHAIKDAMRPASDPRKLHGIVTAPISKEAWHLAGFKWPGHTELLAHRAKAKRVCMVFESPALRVALATVHMPLMDVRHVLTIGRVFDPIDLGHQACRLLGIESPRIAVCGLNPHAGEGGVLGDDEIRVIAPAIEMARNAGIDAHGPFPADTIFRDAVAGSWDLVVAMYHDQGLIPLKLVSMGSAINWTMGLPFVRTSPDHGTAYDIAGRGMASHDSMKAAIDLSISLVRRSLNPDEASGQPAG